jgi:RNA polymerase sigma factor (sigma-70 family)
LISSIEESTLARDFGEGRVNGGTLSEPELRAVEDVLDFIRRKNRLAADEWEDFHSWVWVRLAQTGYGALRKFERRGSLRQFLAVTLHRLLLDYRAAKWGKWRPSSRARNLGPDAEQLEFYLQRQGYSIGQAVQTMKLNHGSMRSEEELERIASELPVRIRRREQTDDLLDRVASAEPTPFDSLEAKDIETEEQRTMEALEAAVTGLGSEERVIVKMRFEQGCKLNEVAAALGLKPSVFYRRFERLLRTMRAALESKGVSAGCIDRLFPDRAVGRTAKPSVSIHDKGSKTQLQSWR